MNNLVEAHPEGKTCFSEANGAVSLSSSPRAAGRCPVSSHSRTNGGCPLRFPGTSALFWDRVRLVTKLSSNATGCMGPQACSATLKCMLKGKQKVWFLFKPHFCLQLLLSHYDSQVLAILPAHGCIHEQQISCR